MGLSCKWMCFSRRFRRGNRGVGTEGFLRLMKRIALIITILGFLITNIAFADRANFIHYCSITEEIMCEVSQLSTYDLAAGTIDEALALGILQQLKDVFNKRTENLVDNELIRVHQYNNRSIDIVIEQLILTNKYKTKSIGNVEWWIKSHILRYKLKKIEHRIRKEMKRLSRRYPS